MKDFKVYQASGYLTKLVTDASDVRKAYEEISGSLVQFDTPISAPLESLIVDINPVQSGTGDPSPDNLRPITGWTGANIYHSGEDTANPTVYPVSWQNEAGTVYGGMVDVKNGVLTLDKVGVDLGSLTWSKGTGGKFYTWVPTPYPFGQNVEMICSRYKFDGPGMSGRGYYGENETFRYYPYPTNPNTYEIYIHDDRYEDSDATAFKTAVSGEYIVYERATPLTYTITPQEISTLIGVNNIWADTGDVSVKYRTH